ncbi:baseplate assembly protein [Ferviditalea candida]|uniref:Baseplate J/gp47 family protein n=1 Tax=Ferviditalea candida TaxID=3108399 RepID=A0ABU5ZKP2_9BACL|nr:baseplate J/gp47 family protein [Paenibacillaceae bacterium T2]
MTTEFQPIQFVDADAQGISTELIQAYEKATGITLYPGDPRRIFFLQLVPVLLALKNDINYTGNQNLLPFADGDVLDALGDRIGVPRLAAQPATVTIRFTLSSIQLDPVAVPIGTRVTPDGSIYFATTQELVIAAGATTGDVTAESTEGGEKYNGFVAGQINILVDPVPYVASVTNTDISSGGSDAETDDAYRERQRLAPSSFSVAGPTNAYIFWAMSADVTIVDVAVTSPSAGVVNVYPLLKDGGIPNQTILDKVLAEVNASDRRPLTDQVSVLAPTAVNYDITLTYYISAERSTEEAAIRAAIENAGGAIDQYEAWQKAKLGRAVTPDDLLSKMYAVGAYRVVATSPVYTAINANEVAIRNLKTVTYGGLI